MVMSLLVDVQSLPVFQPSCWQACTHGDTVVDPGLLVDVQQVSVFQPSWQQACTHGKFASGWWGQTCLLMSREDIEGSS